MTISICQVFEGGTPRKLAAMEDDIIYIGREPPEGGVIIESKAVSREHAVFMRISDLWFYKDLGSSNGSWLNGQHVSAGVPFLLRSNDTIQLADSVIKLLGDDGSDLEVPCIAVFCRGDFLGTFPIPQVGKVVSIGGTQADLKLDVDFGDLPVVVIEKRANFVCAFPVATGDKAMLNNQPLTQLVQLKDRDTVSVSPYILIVSIPGAHQLDLIGSENKLKNEELKETFTSWEEHQKPYSHTIFGQFQGSTVDQQNQEGFDETEQTIVSDMRPGGRFTSDASESQQEAASLIEERVVFILGFLMVLLILSLVLWWFLA